MNKEEIKKKINNAELEIGQRVFQLYYANNFEEIRKEDISVINGIEIITGEIAYRVGTEKSSNISRYRESLLTQKEFTAKVCDLYNTELKILTDNFNAKARELKSQREEALKKFGDKNNPRIEVKITEVEDD